MALENIKYNKNINTRVFFDKLLTIVYTNSISRSKKFSLQNVSSIKLFIRQVYQVPYLKKPKLKRPYIQDWGYSLPQVVIKNVKQTNYLCLICSQRLSEQRTMPYQFCLIYFTQKERDGVHERRQKIFNMTAKQIPRFSYITWLR